MKRAIPVLTLVLVGLLGLTPSLRNPGVVYEIEVKDHDASPPRTEETMVQVEGKNLAMSVAAGDRGGKGEMIFRGDRREMIVVDHDEKTYVVIDEAAMAHLGGAISEAEAAMAEAMKNLPEKQRKELEKMMKGGMMPGAQAARPKTEVKRTGERETKAGYPCAKYDVLRDGQKTRELWVTDWDNLEGGDEAREAFTALADFFAEMLASLPQDGLLGGALAGGDNMFAEMKEIDGFPIVSRGFDDDGSLEEESTLRSATRRTLDPTEFEPPAGYKRQSMGPQ